MDMNMINGVIRAIVPAALAYAVGKGWIPQSAVSDIMTAVTAAAMAGWSIASNKKSTTPSK